MPPAASTAGPLVVVTANSPAWDCGESCYGGYSLWRGGRHAAFERVFRLFSIRSPELSSDGGWVAYTDFATDNPDSDRVEIRARPISWTPNGELGTPRRVWTASVWNSSFAWSPDGRSLAVLERVGRRPKLTVVDVATGTHRALPTTCAPRSRISDSGRSVAWSPSGIIAFLGRARRRDVGAIYTVHSDATKPCRRMVSAADASDLTWSPDGHRLLFVQFNPNGRDRLMTIRANGRRPRVLRRAYAQAPAWSPDGRWLAYTNLNSGAVRLWRIGSRKTVLRRRAISLSDRPGRPSALERVLWLDATAANTNTRDVVAAASRP